MSDKVLATFRIDPDKWEAFKALASERGNNASAMLVEFVEDCVGGNTRPAQTTDTNSKIDERIDERIRDIDNRIDERIKEAMIDRTAYLSNSLNGILEKLYERIDELEGKLTA
jgi:hypothetical protein